jgi:mono/diheme cytochrome c family protein
MLIAAVSAFAILLAGQSPAGKVDFRRDVQPILQQHCVSCHGSELQMNGFRLDRRADAMRGGSQSDIGPGNADGSRLYHRLIDTKFGQQMPPAGRLKDVEIETIKQWIDQGAEWPDDLSGEVPTPAVHPDASLLMAAIRRGDRPAIDRLFRDAPSAVTHRGPQGATPLMFAALYGDAALVSRMLAAAADPDARDTAGATALMWAVPDRHKMQLLLDAGADVNVRSDGGRSALVVASGIVGAAEAVNLLLDYGADPSQWRASDVSPLREAARVDNGEVFRLVFDGAGRPRGGGVPATFLRTNCTACAALTGAGGPLARRPPEPMPGPVQPNYNPSESTVPTPVAATTATPTAIRAAIERSLPLLQEIDVEFIKHTGCVSCHHNSVVAMAVANARANGYAVNETTARSQLSVIGAYLETWRARTLQNHFIAGGSDTISYLLFGLAVEHYPPDAATDAQAIWLKRRQAADGHWPIQTIRPPIESNDIEVTAVSLRALQAFAPPAQRAEYAVAVDRARQWLTTAKATATEERAFRLLGLSWANAEKDAIRKAARELLARQRADGGWTQLDEGQLADAYATGEALVALRESGAVGATDPAYRKGIEFLLRTQIEDGSWFVESRAVPIQAAFASGFPYGPHQWVSAAATGWAVTALALSK